MSCIIKIPLVPEAPIKKILGIFKINPAKERAYFLEHDHDFFTLNNVLCIPYGSLGEDPQVVMDFIIFKLTTMYGLPQRHAFSGYHHPCYFVNNIQTFLTTTHKEVAYGFNRNESSYLTIDEAVRLRNDALSSDLIGFVECRHDLENDILHESVKDAFERADFIVYEHMREK